MREKQHGGSGLGQLCPVQGTGQPVQPSMYHEVSEPKPLVFISMVTEEHGGGAGDGGGGDGDGGGGTARGTSGAGGGASGGGCSGGGSAARKAKSKSKVTLRGISVPVKERRRFPLFTRRTRLGLASPDSQMECWPATRQTLWMAVPFEPKTPLSKDQLKLVGAVVSMLTGVQAEAAMLDEYYCVQYVSHRREITCLIGNPRLCRGVL